VIPLLFLFEKIIDDIVIEKKACFVQIAGVCGDLIFYIYIISLDIFYKE
jgi:hypothetical protein